MRHARGRGPVAYMGWSHAGYVTSGPDPAGMTCSRASAPPQAPLCVEAALLFCHHLSHVGLSEQNQLKV